MEEKNRWIEKEMGYKIISKNSQNRATIEQINKIVAVIHCVH